MGWSHLLTLELWAEVIRSPRCLSTMDNHIRKTLLILPNGKQPKRMVMAVSLVVVFPKLCLLRTELNTAVLNLDQFCVNLGSDMGTMILVIS